MSAVPISANAPAKGAAESARSRPSDSFFVRLLASLLLIRLGASALRWADVAATKLLPLTRLAMCGARLPIGCLIHSSDHDEGWARLIFPRLELPMLAFRDAIRCFSVTLSDHGLFRTYRVGANTAAAVKTAIRPILRRILRNLVPRRQPCETALNRYFRLRSLCSRSSLVRSERTAHDLA